MSPKWSSKFEIKPGRWVFVPTPAAIENGNKIKKTIEACWIPPSNYYHLKDGGHVEAIKIHLRNTQFIHLDITNFFGCVSKNRITRNLKGLVGYEAAKEIAESSTVLRPCVLPFGFVQSTIIASLCLYKSRLGSYLVQLQKSGVTISVYMDDIILSTNREKINVLANELSFDEVKAELKNQAAMSGFPLNVEKEHGPAHTITAYNIELSHESMHIEPSRLAILIDDYSKTDNEHVKNGIYGYINSINPEQVLELSCT
ncbi:reverse transcriptase domain-containing protein [Iodobacter arcticus]|uniref:Reverse transcriptase domain-containing protein n=1 Tax=Iodobacter arcticus TaxID=590593 RepID=A0ABW2R1F4_9NEIS